MFETKNAADPTYGCLDKDGKCGVNYEGTKKHLVGYNCGQYIALPTKLPRWALPL